MFCLFNCLFEFHSNITVYDSIRDSHTTVTKYLSHLKGTGITDRGEERRVVGEGGAIRTKNTPLLDGKTCQVGGEYYRGADTGEGR